MRVIPDDVDKDQIKYVQKIVRCKILNTEGCTWI